MTTPTKTPVVSRSWNESHSRKPTPALSRVRYRAAALPGARTHRKIGRSVDQGRDLQMLRLSSQLLDHARHDLRLDSCAAAQVDARAHRSAFSLTPEYLAHSERGLAGGKLWFSEYGIQLSRGFRALKVLHEMRQVASLRDGKRWSRRVA